MAQPKLTRRGFLAGTAATGAAAALALSGCGSSSSSSSEGSGAAGSATPASAITAAAAYSSTNCNPIGNSSALMLAATWHVFEGLYDLDLHNYTTYTALADGEPTKVSDTVYEVGLRDGAMFSDGTEVTSADVVKSFEANMADDTYGAFLSFIDTVEAKDDKTVTINLKYPFDSLLKGRLSVVKIFPASATEDELKTMPIGSGPWMYDSINGDEGGVITFKPNPNYNGTLPATCEEMEWNVLLDATSRTTHITDGSVLAIENVPDTNADQIAASGAAVEYVPGFALPFLMFNTKKAPFDDPRVRQAFFYAIDVEKLIENQMDGHAVAATSFLPEAYANYHRASTVYSHDVDKAKQLLQEAGQEKITCELMVNNNWVSALSAQIKEDLAAAGIDVTINETKIDWAALAPSEEILPYDVMLTPGDPSCFGNDPDLLMTWWYGDNVWTQGRSCWNTTPEWAELQTLLQTAREASDATQQQETWNQCFDLIAENVPLYPLFHRETGTAYIADKLENFAPISTTGLVFLGTTPLE
ncbi:MAG: ABC transporter substrate-binding protein [Eggerthellaceae bacterium]|nr:ABC transporter substrate-binding protein [Eggerthellaceae bacterium]